jgi:hypothetical protein
VLGGARLNALRTRHIDDRTGVAVFEKRLRAMPGTARDFVGEAFSRNADASGDVGADAVVVAVAVVVTV